MNNVTDVQRFLSLDEAKHAVPADWHDIEDGAYAHKNGEYLTIRCVASLLPRL